MESKIYGILDDSNCLVDISRSERSTKRYATLNGHNKIGYRVGYNVFVCAEKIKNKWVTIL